MPWYGWLLALAGVIIVCLSAAIIIFLILLAKAISQLWR